MGSSQKRQRQIFLYGHMRSRPLQRVLKQAPDDPASSVFLHKRDVLSVQTDGAVVHIEASRDGVQHRRFSRPVGADDRSEISRLQMQGQILNRMLFIDRAWIKGFTDMFQP